MAMCLLFLLGVLTMTGCNNAQDGSGLAAQEVTPPPTLTAPVPVPSPTPAPTPGQVPEPLPWPLPPDLLERPPVILQLTPLTPGEELVVFHTNFGDIKLRLFPQAAPNAVKNFVTHARNGFYDGLIFHRVIENFMLQGGCAEGTGRAGESIWGVGFGPEHNYDLWHFRGALAMAQTGAGNSIGSQFYIVHNPHLDPGFRQEFELILERYMDDYWFEDPDGGPGVRFGEAFPREMLEHYLAVGGTPFLDFPFNPSGPNFGHTVFGHVVEGMEVVDAIAATPTDAGDRPLEDVIIERVSIINYQG